MARTRVIDIKIEDVLALFGGQAANVAWVLQTSTQNVSGWVASGIVPECRQYELQVKSGGLLVAESWDPERDYIAECRRERRITR